MFLECPSTCASRRILFTNVSKILTDENVFSYSEFAALNPAELVEIVLFGHPKRLKVRHCASSDRRVCFCPEIHPFTMTSPFDTFSVCTVLFVCMCVIFLLC